MSTAIQEWGTISARWVVSAAFRFRCVLLRQNLKVSLLKLCHLTISFWQ